MRGTDLGRVKEGKLAMSLATKDWGYREREVRQWNSVILIATMVVDAHRGFMSDTQVHLGELLAAMLQTVGCSGGGESQAISQFTVLDRREFVMLFATLRGTPHTGLSKRR